MNDNEKTMVGTFQGQDVTGLSAGELMQLIYNALDEDGDGDISREELKQLDTDGDGFISKEELMDFASRYEKKQAGKSSQGENNDGYLDVN